MKNISFSMTLEQFKNRKKFVTRRMGWHGLAKRSDLQAVEKAQGLKKGEKIQKLDVIRVFFVSSQPLNSITRDDVVLEGFPDWTTQEFIEFFCKSHRCKPDAIVTRIEFGYYLPDGRILTAVNVKGKEIETQIITKF